MIREGRARFWERPEVKFLRATRQKGSVAALPKSLAPDGWTTPKASLQAPLEDRTQCNLMPNSATTDGRKELIGFTDGVRDSTRVWRDLLLELKQRSLHAPVKGRRRCASVYEKPPAESGRSSRTDVDEATG